MVIGLLVFMTGCPKPANKADSKDPKGMVYFTFFDTVSYIYSYVDDSEKEFDQNCKEVSEILSEYHALFDIYHEHSGVNNLCTVNKNAGGDWITVDGKLIDFLLYAKELYIKTGGEMNIMLGSVLKLWHDQREIYSSAPSSARLPTEAELIDANSHTSFELLEIDGENCRVRITDKDARIDVGALGKGYATEMAAKHLISRGISGYVLNIGGNIRIIGEKPDGSGWNTGIKDPSDPQSYAQYITIKDTSCVTSGDYERYFTVNGERYHHVIDKDTLFPSKHFSSVTVITSDSGVADTLSTALFCMSYEDGLKLLSEFPDTEVLWIAKDGTSYQTEGFKSLITKK